MYHYRTMLAFYQDLYFVQKLDDFDVNSERVSVVSLRTVMGCFSATLCMTVKLV